jgi:C1A family cysteine protease
MTSPHPDTPPLPARRIKGLGWRPDTPDIRDRIFNHNRVLRKLRGRLPGKVDLRDPILFGRPFDQGDLGSCTANAIGKAYRYQHTKQGLAAFDPSRLFIYYAEREIEGTIGSDAGAEIRDGIKVLATLGTPSEDVWRYDIGRFTQRPAEVAFQEAIRHNALAYESVRVERIALKAALAAGHPVVVGFSVYESFYNIRADGLMPVPDATRERLEGGHAVLVVGYKTMKGRDGKRRDHAIILNSWGDSWGDLGYFYMPIEWLCCRDNADDFWCITIAEAA